MVVSISMGWRHVLFANWPIDPEVIDPHVPESVDLDLFDGDAWISIIAFLNTNIRPRWFPFEIGVSLPELNLRTYVTYKGTEGIYFFSLDADGILAVLGARMFHHLPYYFSRINIKEDEDLIQFSCRRRHPGARPLRFTARYTRKGERFYAGSNSIHSFLTDRYRYFTESSDEQIRYAEVFHDPWPLYGANVEIEFQPIFEANGITPPKNQPLYLLSPGVDTATSRSKTIK